jgi:hypothetical protein
MKTRNKVLATVIAGLISTSAFAATDGSMGSTSEGRIDLDLEVLDSVEITGLADVDFGQYGGTDIGDINGGDSYCVYRNGADGYTITPTSTNGSFALTGATGDSINYSVKLAGAATGADLASAVSYNSASSTFSGSSARDCGGSDNASVDVSIAEDDIRTASTGTYADTLILLVSPI